MKITILGGGLSALSFAFFIQDNKEIDEINIIEKADEIGGLCRSFIAENGIEYDVGPHIIFSKDKEILDFMVKLLGENIQKHRRSNWILHKSRKIQYPFENDLSKLNQDDLRYCVNAFLHNPYESYENSENMLQFFLKTFGEGITNLYLRPYNEKIWKFDPSFMNTKMVDRIPKPPKEDILRSANGETVDGYTHQLFFYYPKLHGTSSIIDSLKSKLNSKVHIHTSCHISNIYKKDDIFFVETNKELFDSERIVSTIPVNELVKLWSFDDEFSKKDIISAGNNLKYNSICIGLANVKCNKPCDGYAFMIADKNVIFHRLSKLDFMGGSYHHDGSETYMIEVTYRKKDRIDEMPDDELISKIIDGLKEIKFISSKNDINFVSVKRFEYAYIIYDLNYYANINKIKSYFESHNLKLNGRFGSFEYLNMDAVIRQSLELSKKI